MNEKDMLTNTNSTLQTITLKLTDDQISSNKVYLDNTINTIINSNWPNSTLNYTIKDRTEELEDRIIALEHEIYSVRGQCDKAIAALIDALQGRDEKLSLISQDIIKEILQKVL